MRCLVVLAALFFAASAHAVTMDWVEVSDPGNGCDVQSQGCFGSVGYTYSISKHEVTNAQYAEFLNAVAAIDTYSLYHPFMGDDNTHGGITQSGSEGSYTYGVKAGMENKPVTFVSFWDSLRFANWLHNGEPWGIQDGTTTEDGAYTLAGYTGDGGVWIERNAWATVFLPSEDEWYKAAYYDPVSTSYFDYPAKTDTPTVCAFPGPTANTANCAWVVGSVTDVGSYTGSASPNGTFDQGGNVFEWNEAIFYPERGTRGGTWGGGDSGGLAASHRGSATPIFEFRYTGFRVARIGECDDGLDNDGDGLTDYVGGDPGCADADDLFENDPTLPCDDGADNDGDGRIDFDPVTFANPGDETTPPSGSGDPGCGNPTSPTENPQCQDGFNNDLAQDYPNPGHIDYDGGASLDLDGNGFIDAEFNPAEPAITDPDPQCVGAPWKNNEFRQLSCGLGTELALLLPPLMWMWRRRRTMV
jgi:formylglycine-generating enzyme required for sulfatase activity